MKQTFKEYTTEKQLRDINNSDGHLSELKFGKVHVAFTETNKGVDINTTSPILSLSRSEVKELINSLSNFIN